MKFAIISLLGLAFLNGCVGAPPPPEKTLVVYGHELDQVFTDQRGCTVYRFYDMGDWRYYVVGPNGGAQMLPTTTHVTETQTDTDTIVVDSGGGGGGGGGSGHHK